MVVWIVGKDGMLARELAPVLINAGHGVFGTGREVSILEPAQLAEFARRLGRVDWIVNCAAFTKVELAEEQSALALELNVVGSQNVAELARSIDAKLMYISTDYVFSQTENHNQSTQLAFCEADKTNPLNHYGRTKLLGEEAALAHHAKALVMRTSWLYGRNGNNFVKTIVEKLKTQGPISVVNDQWGAPTSAFDLARAICTIIEQPQQSFGIYHYSNQGATTWYNFACEIKRIFASGWGGLSLSPIGAIKSIDYPTKAPRPSWSVLDCTKIQQTYNITINSWESSLAVYLGWAGGLG